MGELKSMGGYIGLENLGTSLFAGLALQKILLLKKRCKSEHFIIKSK
jgi:hypothetical protein